MTQTSISSPRKRNSRETSCRFSPMGKRAKDAAAADDDEDDVAISSPSPPWQHAREPVEFRVFPLFEHSKLFRNFSFCSSRWLGRSVFLSEEKNFRAFRSPS